MLDLKKSQEDWRDDDVARGRAFLLRAVLLFGVACCGLHYAIGSWLGTMSEWFREVAPYTAAFFLLCALWCFAQPRRYLVQASAFCLGVFVLFASIALQACVRGPGVDAFQIQNTLQWLPVLYVIMFVFLGRAARPMSWLAYLGFVLIAGYAYVKLQPVQVTNLPHRRFISSLSGLALAHPVYIVALMYIERLNQGLAAARDQRAQDRVSLLAQVGHEVRTPLQSILSSAELFADRQDQAPAQQRAASRIRNSARVLHAYLSNMMALAKLDSGAPALRPTAFDLDATLHDIVEEANACRPAGSAPAQVDGIRCGTVVGDEHAVRQVMVNLCSNALKYGANKRVLVRAQRAEEIVVLAVEDQGAGIPPELIEQMWQPWVRGPDASRQGSGLGLAVVRRLVDAMNGSVRVVQPEQGGACFEVRLPLPAAASGAAAANGHWAAGSH